MTPDEQRELLLAQTADAAAEFHGVISLLCAALVHRWQIKALPTRPQITVGRNQRVDRDRAANVQIRRLDLPPRDVERGAVTSIERTVLDCTRSLSFDEGLCVADSALRSGMSKQRLLDLAAGAKGPGSRRIRWVAHHASPLAANPFESVLRALALSVGLRVQPQVRLGGDYYLGRPDLVDIELRIILEADSFESHGTPAALRRDASRYNEFVINGWLVLRFTWEQVMFQPEQVRRILLGAITERRTNRGAGGGSAA
ncbi:Protein of unknown function [Nocardioides terrae]|uniref:DUF559 domain-containing protein n=1 Tax=Nocardioides terrae TaxID=574651 RepID=A0A1I1I3K9_9ACTN|nr:DUF559 domain-containing protein [Nocardioides terrae]SFC30766.1 Protein of unknown function [Nocardioides terrae]